MVLSGRPSAAAPASGTSGAAGGMGGGAKGGTTGGIGGGANGGTTGGIGGGANGGTTGGGASGPGRAIGMPAMSEIGAHPVTAGTSPAEFWRHSDPPACATPGLNPKATPHNPAPTAATLMLSRSKIATDHHSISFTRRLPLPAAQQNVCDTEPTPPVRTTSSIYRSTPRKRNTLRGAVSERRRLT
jgi:hypothetical protein